MQIEVSVIYDFTAVVITQNSRNSFSGEFRVIVFGPIHKNNNSDFLMTRGIMLGSENSEFQVIFFCPVPKNDNLEFYFCIWDHAWK